MLSSPVRRGTPVLAFCLGLVAGGMVTAAALLVIGSLVRAPLPQPARWAIAVAALAAMLLQERGVVRLRLPENRRLVPESVFRLGRHLGPLAFGVEMGTGARTYLPSALPYAAAAAVLLLASVPAALSAGAGFGLGRALMTTANLRYSADNRWDELWLRRPRQLASMMALAFAASLAAVAVVATR
ncbi:MAG TPA: hypothetical protein VOB72_08940 [Candidatus Dormibacteraeota bacterium]|nr:hypothetical protein [Candidatus Dormibacteraeota bacterium]